ncbi:hypothetical protein NE237_021832 [Protea cynaroides]|uniref:NYN domain-containing protein n=1 Tax=Protea cynaroides TaxID=273540 RepID=A0A9Q0K3X5_9MAGN|nr:hypothetical protein NE237_021832 [Protea cynaroides]
MKSYPIISLRVSFGTFVFVPFRSKAVELRCAAARNIEKALLVSAAGTGGETDIKTVLSINNKAQILFHSMDTFYEDLDIVFEMPKIKERARRRQVTRRTIVWHINEFAKRYPPPITIMLITGDQRLIPSVLDWAQNGHNILLVTPRQVCVPSAVLDAIAGRLFSWEMLARGDGLGEIDCDHDATAVKCHRTSTSLSIKMDTTEWRMKPDAPIKFAGIFWDLVTCSIPDDIVKPGCAVQNMKKALLVPGIEEVHIIHSIGVTGERGTIGRSIDRSFHDMATMVYLSNLGQNDRNEEILWEIEWFAECCPHPQIAIIMLITGDEVLIASVLDWAKKGYKIVLVTPPEVCVPSAVLDVIAGNHFSWETLARGEGLGEIDCDCKVY